MDSINVASLLKVFSEFGPLGLVIFLWWYDNRRIVAVLKQYKEDMDSQRKMYETNVSLVKDYHSVASDLRDVVIMVTQQMTTVASEIRQNEFCPLTRIKKEQVLQKGGY